MDKRLGVIGSGGACALALVAILSLPGCVTDPAARAELEANEKYLVQSLESARKFSARADALRQEFSALRLAHEKGEIDTRVYMKESARLVPLLIDTALYAKNAQESADFYLKEAKRIRAEYGVPWWQVAGSVISSVVQTYGGWGVLGGALVAIFPLLRARKWKAASRKLMASIENGGNKKTKADVKAWADATIEDELKQLKVFWKKGSDGKPDRETPGSGG